MDFPIQEVDSEELTDNFLVKELISAYKAHIKTLESEINRLKEKYEPKVVQVSPDNVRVFPPQKPKVATTSQLIRELEKRTGIKPGKVEEKENV